MKRSLRWPSLAVLVIGVASVREAAAQGFTLDFEGVEALWPCGDTEPRSAAVFCRLRSAPGAPEVEGWSIAVTSTRLRFTGVSVEGTMAEAAAEDGFVHNEVVTTAEGQTAISVVWLSFGAERVTLPGGVPHRIARVDVERIEQTPLDSVMLRYTSGVRGAAGLIDTSVTSGGRSFFPQLVNLRAFVSRHVKVGFTASDVNSEETWHGIIGGSSASGELEYFVPPGSKAVAHVFPAVILEPESTGALWAWDMSIEIEGNVGVAGATTAGTGVHRRLGGDLATAEVVGARAGRSGGVVSAFVHFRLGEDDMETGTYSLLEIALDGGWLEPGGERSATLTFRDGLSGASRSFDNLIALTGDFPMIPCNQQEASVTVRFRDPDAAFVRGDVNGDEKINAADPLAILARLFRGGPDSVCSDAEDANHDGRIDLSDAVFLLRHLFLGDEPPAQPYPACGRAGHVSKVRLGCQQAQGSCAER